MLYLIHRELVVIPLVTSPGFYNWAEHLGALFPLIVERSCAGSRKRKQKLGGAGPFKNTCCPARRGPKTHRIDVSSASIAHRACGTSAFALHILHAFILDAILDEWACCGFGVNCFMHMLSSPVRLKAARQVHFMLARLMRFCADFNIIFMIILLTSTYLV